MYKILVGLLDVWCNIGDEIVKEVFLKLVGWVEERNVDFSFEQMQKILEVEYGGM